MTQGLRTRTPIEFTCLYWTSSSQLTLRIVYDSTVNSPKKSSVRLDIQGLRALAVILVALNHVLGTPAGGFVGVDVFFVISGFIITSVLLREFDRTGTISFGNFYIRRVKRILPAALLVILVTLLASTLLMSYERAQAVAGDSFWALFFGANWNMLLGGVDYFAEGLPPSPLQHYWSLSIEEQFYFVWPWLMLGVLLFATRRRGSGSGRGWLLFAISTIVVISFGWALFETNTSPGTAYFNSFARFWELGFGALLAIVVPALKPTRSFVAASLAYLGLAIIIVSVVLISEETPFPGFAAVLPVLGAGLILFAGVGQSATYDRALAPLTNPIAKYLGDISYSLYLWHFPLTVLLLTILPEGPVYYALTLGGTLVLSVLSYHFVENPIRTSMWMEHNESSAAREKRRTVITMGIATTAAVALAASSYVVMYREADSRAQAYVTQSQLELDTARAATDGAVNEAGAAALRCVGAGYLDPANQPCNMDSLTLTPSVGSLADDVGTQSDLACRRTDSPEPVSCTFGSQAPDALKVALIGDSHAGVYLPVLREIANEKNWSLTTYIGNGCQWASRSQDECGRQLDVAQADFLDATPYDLIISAAARKFTSTWSATAVDSAVSRATEAASAGSKVVYLEDVPIPSEESLRCLERVGFDPKTSVCGTDAAEAFQQPDQIALAFAEVPSVSVVSMNDLLCMNDFCPAVIGHVITYRDTVDHLTVAYARSMKAQLSERLETAMST